MKPLFLKIQSPPLSSFSVRRDYKPNINNEWHYHQELELIHIHRGRGTQFIGDSVRSFQAGDVILVGPNLPHYWNYEDGIDQDNSHPFSTVIHFKESVLGDKLMNLPESRNIKSVLEKAKHGLLITAQEAAPVASLIDKLPEVSGINRLTVLMETLDAIAGTRDHKVLSSGGIQHNYTKTRDERIQKVYAFTMEHFHERIELKDVASVAGLVENSFCRYFKSRTGRTYLQFLTDIRVGQACKLLIEDKMTVKEICYSIGFNNMSCFFSKFKTVTGKTPLEYKEEAIK